MPGNMRIKPPLPPVKGWAEQTKPFGMAMTQNRYAPMVWSFAFENHQPYNIIELGTANAGFTTILGVHAWNLEPKVRIETFETGIAPDIRFTDLCAFLGIKFHNHTNVFEHEAMIGEMIRRPGTTYLLCDDGDHPKEFNVFAKYLKVGDIIAAHDYWCPSRLTNGEVDPNQDNSYWIWDQTNMGHIGETVKKEQLRPFYQEYFDMTGWIAFMKEP